MLASQKKRSRTRRPSFCKTETSLDTSQTGSFMTTLMMAASGRRPLGELTWNPNDASPYGKDRKKNDNLIDKRSLYAIKREQIASRDLRFLTDAPGSRQVDPTTTNVEHLVEKNYIINSRLSNVTPEKFPGVILRRFHRVSRTDQNISYGMPRPPTARKNPFQLVMDGIRREPSIVNIKQFPSLQEPVYCSEADEFCEILGPSSCQTCIENTNRHIGEELQHMVFPTIDMSTDKLIVPKLAKILKDGHRLQIRKRRLRELGIEMPEDLMNINRRETHLTSSTCLTCKKPIKATTKIRVSSPSGRPVRTGQERLYRKTRTARF